MFQQYFRAPGEGIPGGGPAGEAGFEYEDGQTRAPEEGEKGRVQKGQAPDPAKRIQELERRLDLAEQDNLTLNEYRQRMSRHEPLLEKLAGLGGTPEGDKKSTFTPGSISAETQALLESNNPALRQQGVMKVISEIVAQTMDARFQERETTSSKRAEEDRKINEQRLLSYQAMAGDQKAPHLKALADWSVQPIKNIQALKQVDPQRFDRDWAWTESIPANMYHHIMSAILAGLELVTKGDKLSALLSMQKAADDKNQMIAGQGAGGVNAKQGGGKSTGSVFEEVHKDLMELRGDLGDEH